jgi:hypothetical protein
MFLLSQIFDEKKRHNQHRFKEGFDCALDLEARVLHDKAAKHYFSKLKNSIGTKLGKLEMQIVYESVTKV